MALAPTLYDFDLQLAHVDRGLEARLQFKAARHPSESLERLWLRALAFAYFHRERIAFGPGLSEPDEPDLLAEDLTGQRTLWVRVGRPDPERVQKEADRAKRADHGVVFESPRALASFCEEAREKGLSRLGKVELLAVDPPLIRALCELDDRRVKASLTIVGDHLYLERGKSSLDGPLTRENLQS